MSKALLDNIELWTGATRAKSTSGRGNNSKIELVGIKKLRELILELAVQGKLVPQDPTDEPASVLLQRIEEEKARLVAEGKLRKQKPLPPVDEEEQTFELPVGWEWVRLGNIGDWGAGATPPRGNANYYGGGIPWFKSGELTSDFISESEESVTEKALSECSLRLNSVGDVLIAMYGATIGKTSILKVQGTTNQAVCACTPFSSVSNTYLLTLLKASKSRFTGMGAGGAQPNISREKIIATIIGLPPLAEQHRIVAKVDELMTLCDQLEQQSEHQLDAHQRLVETLLGTLTQSQSADELAANWQRLAAHFDLLFSGPLGEWAIDRLKDTILQLAVMGKLVPQNPEDEPAQRLYENVQSLPVGYVRSNKQQIREKPVSEIDKLPVLPNTWIYLKVDDLYKTNHILDYADGNHGSLYPTKDDFSDEGVLFLTATQISEQGIIDWNACPRLKLTKAKELSKGWSQEGDVYFTHNATVGRTAVAVNGPEKRFLLGTSVTYFRINSETINKNYLYYYLKSPSWQSQASAIMQQTTRNQVSITKQALFYIALPPLDEQQRIVDKIDELFALCDQLKTRLSQASETQLNLTEALVEQALL